MGENQEEISWNENPANIVAWSGGTNWFNINFS